MPAQHAEVPGASDGTHATAVTMRILNPLCHHSQVDSFNHHNQEVKIYTQIHMTSKIWVLKPCANKGNT